MLFELQFYWIAIPAVLLTGVSKGGFGGGIAMMGTPMIALVVPPLTAAAIMLPVLLLMDAISLVSYRGKVKWAIIAQMIPGAMVGTAIGWAAAAHVSDNMIRILVGTIAITFAVHQTAKDLRRMPAAEQSLPRGAFWGAVAGFTSFVSHAGGPPYQAYTVPLKLEKLLYAGTSVMFFAIVNSSKVVPYLALGQFSSINLLAALSLMPVAIAGTGLGIWLVRRIRQELFYRITYTAMLIVGAKLIWDGVSNW